MRYFLVLFVLFFGVNLLAQDVIIDLDENGDVIIFNVQAEKEPLIEISYTITSASQQDFQRTEFIKNLGDLQLRLGYTYISDAKIRKIYEEYILVGYSSPDFALSQNDGYLSFDTWKLGSISRIGYSIPVSSGVSFVPYYSGGLFFYSMKFEDDGASLMTSANDKTIISRTADGKIHFGNMFESGLRLKFNNSLSVFGGYTGNVYYPRFMTWKFLGSLITYQIGLTLLDNFNRHIIKRSNVAGVLVDVILKSAYNYMFYYFQKGNMNWPVSTETPFVHEGVNFGFSFNF